MVRVRETPQNPLISDHRWVLKNRKKTETEVIDTPSKGIISYHQGGAPKPEKSENGGENDTPLFPLTLRVNEGAIRV